MCSHRLTPAVGDRKPLKPDFHLRGWSAEEGLEEGGVGRALPESRAEMMVAWLHGVDSKEERRRSRVFARSAEVQNKQDLGISGRRG